jgi:hypothetical protein
LSFQTARCAEKYEQYSYREMNNATDLMEEFKKAAGKGRIQGTV